MVDHAGATRLAEASDVVETAGGWLAEPQPQDLVLTLLADNVRRRLDLVWSGGLVQILELFGFSIGASRVAFSRLARRRLIARVKEGRQVYYQLTERAERVLSEGDERIFGFGRQQLDPSTVTIVWHNLPEDRRLERGRLARRLRFLGFGSPQDGTWVAVGKRDVQALRLIDELDVRGFATVLCAQPAGGSDLSALVTGTWDVEGLETLYTRFVAMFGGVDPEEVTGCDAFRLRTQVIHNFRQFVALDPELDGVLGPHHEDRHRAIELFHHLYAGLAPAALAYFDQVAGGHRPGEDG
ncbi:MAG: PaaX family transcriptional regulator [Actinobacteria bacterium]|nr:PaaX family transcriptional regulator [Actinomycetota bacterium]